MVMTLHSHISIPSNREEDVTKFCNKNNIHIFFFKLAGKLCGDIDGESNKLDELLEQMKNWEEEDKKKSWKYKIRKKLKLS